jgi:hypothetical protein
MYTLQIKIRTTNDSRTWSERPIAFEIETEENAPHDVPALQALALKHEPNAAEIRVYTNPDSGAIFYTVPQKGKMIIHCEEHLAAVRAFADRTNQREALEEKLNQLLWDNLYTHLYSDGAPMSFYFVMRETDEETHKFFMNGGLIYHGKLEDNTRPETLSVTLTPCNSWSIHT